MSFNEDTRVKIPSILHLCRMGYTYISLKGRTYDENTVVQIMTGSIQKKINQENLLNVKTLMVENEYLDKFSSLINPIRQKQIQLYEETQQLQQLRDWLLPMLMNGQVEVGG